MVENDYNSTKLIFEFKNDNGYTKIFQLLRPDGSTWRKEIINDELVLATTNDNNEVVSVLTCFGRYFFDVVFYKGDSKVTTTKREEFFVRDCIPDHAVDTEPKNILDDLIAKVNKAIEECNNLDLDFVAVDDGAKITITKKDGSKKSVVIKASTSTDGDTDSLTEEQIQALNEMTASINEEGELEITYNENVLDFEIQIQNDELIVENNMEEVDFAINSEKELEVMY